MNYTQESALYKQADMVLAELENARALAINALVDPQIQGIVNVVLNHLKYKIEGLI